MNPILSMVLNSEALQERLRKCKTKESRLIEEALLVKGEIKDEYLKTIELDGISKKLSKCDDLYKMLFTNDNHLELSSKDIRSTWFKEIKEAFNRCPDNDFFLVVSTSVATEVATSVATSSPQSQEYNDYIEMLYAFAKELPCKDMLLKKDGVLYYYNKDNAKMNNGKVIRFGKLSTTHEYVPFMYHLDKTMYDIGTTPTIHDLMKALLNGTGFSYDV